VQRRHVVKAMEADWACAPQDVQREREREEDADGDGAGGTGGGEEQGRSKKACAGRRGGAKDVAVDGLVLAQKHDPCVYEHRQHRQLHRAEREPGNAYTETDKHLKKKLIDACALQRTREYDRKTWRNEEGMRSTFFLFFERRNVYGGPGGPDGGR